MVAGPREAGVSMLRRHPRLLAAITAALTLHGLAWLTLVGPQSVGVPDRQMGTGLVVQLVDGRSAPVARRDQSAENRAADRMGMTEPVPTARDGVRRDGAESERPEPTRGNDEYVDARRLSIRPSPLTRVVLPQKEMEASRRSGKASLTVFIDAAGIVVRVRVDASDLPVEVNNAVRQVFYDAPFRPGQLDGRAVKSMMHVEVVFETERPGSSAEEHVPAI